MKRGFTLIELLIVVAIIAILAAIAVPNFLEAQARSKVARCKADMRSISLGLESYQIDNNKYPPSELPGGSPDNNWAKSLSRLSTPIAYMTSIPEDIFDTQGSIGNGALHATNHSFEYYRFLPGWTKYGASQGNIEGAIRNGFKWCLLTVGPSRMYADQSGQAQYLGNQPWNILSGHNAAYFYDPTNGTISRGYIFLSNKGFVTPDMCPK